MTLAERIEEATRNLSRDVTRLHALDLFLLLQRWVSELEPQICIDHRTGRLLGLGYADELVLPIEVLGSDDW